LGSLEEEQEMLEMEEGEEDEQEDDLLLLEHKVAIWTPTSLSFLRYLILISFQFS
jgi:hypothetical protein